MLTSDKAQTYLERFRNLTDVQMQRHLADGPDSFVSGVYQILLEEATRRGLRLEQAKAATAEATKKHKLQTIKWLTFWGYFAALAVFGVPGMIIGTKLKSLSEDPEMRGRTAAKVNGTIIQIISSIILLLALAGIIYRIAAPR